MSLNPERSAVYPGVPPVEFGVESEALEKVFFRMSQVPEGGAVYGRRFGISTNWREIHDFRYDIYKHISIGVYLDYKTEDQPGRPKYHSTYYISGELSPIWELLPIRDIQAELGKEGINMDLVSKAPDQFAGEATLLSENPRFLSIHQPGKPERDKEWAKESIVVAQHLFNRKRSYGKDYYSRVPFDLEGFGDFKSKFDIITDALGKLIKVEYRLSDKELPEAKLILRPEENKTEEEMKQKKITCDYCGSIFPVSQHDKCPHCGGNPHLD